ncbi:MAG: hypothetical protein SGI92_29190 [Bryobacteraceae bacterium]|nr:hypothetical protein [Bryobacteraceae bacterium]
MDAFLADAQSILRTGLDSVAAGMQPTEMVILTGVCGTAVHLLAECDWPLESVREDRGATSAYRITSRSRTVVVEGTQRGGRKCRLEQSVPFRNGPLHFGHSFTPVGGLLLLTP